MQKSNFKQLTAATLLLLTSFAQMQAEAPSGYYDRAEGLNKGALLEALESIVGEHTNVGYDGVWEVFKESDVREDGTIWDMYSTSRYTPGKDQNHGQASSVGDNYNREHSMPKSWFNDAQPMYSDAFHLYPTDSKVNGQRGNYPFGECANGTKLPSANGVDALGRLGRSTFSEYSGTVFEPDDQYKGDFARTYFYMATCYENQIANWNSDMLAGNKYPAYASWAITMLLRWAEEDPVSEKEINRNNEVYKLQKNRNPFIDFPGLEEYIWGDKMDVLFDSENYEGAGEGGDTQVMTPTFTPASGTVSKGTNIQIKTGTPGAQIVYSLNGGAEVQVSNPANLTINESTTITAYAILDGKKSGSATAKYTVNDEGGETPSVSGLWSFTPVTSTADLTPGAQYLIVCEELSVAMGAQGKDIRGYGEISFDNGLIISEVNGNEQPYTFILGGTTGQYTFYDATDKCYVSLNSGDKKLHTQTDGNSKNAQWKIVIDENGTQIISCAYDTQSIQYNAGAPRFACYSSKQKAVCLYKMQSVDFTISDCGYATYYGDQPFYLPAGLQAGVVTDIQSPDNYLNIEWTYQGGSVIPSETGVLIKGNSGDYICNISQTDGEKPTTNWLKGSTEDAETEGTDCLFYKLSTDMNQPIGFYWGAENGGTFTNTAHKAYLAVPKTNANSIKYLPLEKPTGIQQTTSNRSKMVNVYSISGTLIRKQVQERGALDGLPSGIYLINGKKVLK